MSHFKSVFSVSASMNKTRVNLHWNLTRCNCFADWTGNLYLASEGKLLMSTAKIMGCKHSWIWPKCKIKLCSDKTVTTWQQAGSDGEWGLFLVSRFSLGVTQIYLCCKKKMSSFIQCKPANLQSSNWIFIWSRVQCPQFVILKQVARFCRNAIAGASYGNFRLRRTCHLPFGATNSSLKMTCTVRLNLPLNWILKSVDW